MEAFSFTLHFCLIFQGTKHKELALPEGVMNSIQCQTSDPKDIVLQFQDALKLDTASLKNPDLEPETKRLIRGLALKAKCEKRVDLVNYLREITPAGTTGELKLDSVTLQKFQIL